MSGPGPSYSSSYQMHAAACPHPDVDIRYTCTPFCACLTVAAVSVFIVLEDAYIRLPDACLPQGKTRGKGNYTIKDQLGSIVEVHLMTRAFFIKKKQNVVVPKHATEWCAPHVPWAMSKGVEEAWAEVVRRLGNWQEMVAVPAAPLVDPDAD